MRTQREELRWDRRGFGQGKWSQAWASTWWRSARVCETPGGRRVEENPGEPLFAGTTQRKGEFLFFSSCPWDSGLSLPFLLSLEGLEHLHVSSPFMEKATALDQV